MLHRNSQKRIYLKDKIYFITTKTQDNYPYFKDERFCQITWDTINFASKIKEYEIFGFVLLWDHLHLLIQPFGNFNISQIIKSVKENSSRDINKIVKKNFQEVYEGATSTSRLHDDIDVQNNLSHLHHNVINQKFQWQKSFHDHVIRNQSDFNAHINYIKQNPIKHKLISSGQNWPWFYLKPSSWSH